MSKSPSLRRIKADIRELATDPSDQYHAAPLENDMFEWHFTIRGADDTDFAGGIYHGRILLPPEYPFKPPNIVFLTPSGRFETGVKVCLSFSAHHPELWQPAWGIRLILEAIISFLPTPADGALGALDWTPAERKKLAKESVKFRCLTCCGKGETCGDLLPKMKPRGGDDGDDGVKRTTSKSNFHEEIEKLKLLQFQNHAIVEDTAKEDGKIKVDEGSISANLATAVGETQLTQPTQLLPTEAPPSTPVETENKVAVSVSGSVPIKSDDTVTPLGAQPPAASQQTNPRTSATTTATTSPVPAPVPAPAATDTFNDIIHDNPIISDNILHGMIGFFAIIVIFLIRQAQTLLDELIDLEGDDEAVGK
ncbi:hypothetical protein ACHAWU_009705 [Discostella pseudostelligera]|uniref:UBC core domain-containing protein n=1 Tax=Discostella pseudostelligera TaxID=259834 RepID=A0ABD3MQM2_9STRA